VTVTRPVGEVWLSSGAEIGKIRYWSRA